MWISVIDIESARLVINMCIHPFVSYVSSFKKEKHLTPKEQMAFFEFLSDEFRASSHLVGQVERSSAKLLLFLGER